jgi:hypothetical protein
MVDTVDSQVLRNGQNRYAVRLTNISDGTGESAVTKIDRSTLTGPNGVDAPTKLVIEELDWNVQGFTYVHLFWEDSTDQTIDVLSGDSYRDYRHLGGLVPDDFTAQGANPERGDIVLTTAGTTSGNTYDITITIGLKE